MAHPFHKQDPASVQQEPGPADTQTGITRLLPETAWADEAMPSGIPPEDSVVITISRQFGSGGSDIAQLVAARTGLTYVDQHIITEVAERLGVDVQAIAQRDEQTGGLVSHILEAIQASNPLSINYHALFSPNAAVAHTNELTSLRLTQKVILEMATQGNAVIVGRGSQFLLHNAPRTLHISIFAPLPHRINHIMQQFQLQRSEAIHLIEQRDYDQISYQRRYYGNDGQQTSLYHLLINTGLISVTVAADLICQTLPVVKEITGTA